MCVPVDNTMNTGSIHINLSKKHVSIRITLLFNQQLLLVPMNQETRDLTWSVSEDIVKANFYVFISSSDGRK